MAKRFVVKIEVSNDAFKPTECVETARILRTLADVLMQQQNFNDEDYYILEDQDGNTVGGAEIEKLGRGKW